MSATSEKGYVFITCDNQKFSTSWNRKYLECHSDSAVVKKLVDENGESDKINLKFCRSQEFRLFEQYVDWPLKHDMRRMINVSNLDDWLSVANKFQIKNLTTHCVNFVAFEVHDSSPKLDYVLELAKIVCNHKLRSAYLPIVKFYCLYCRNLFENESYVKKLTDFLPKSAMDILRSDYFRYETWKNRFAHDLSPAHCDKADCLSAEAKQCRRCGKIVCEKCELKKVENNPKSSRYKPVCLNCWSRQCQCQPDTCSKCLFCDKKWEKCLCPASDIPEDMWKTDFENI